MAQFPPRVPARHRRPQVVPIKPAIVEEAAQPALTKVKPAVFLPGAADRAANIALRITPPLRMVKPAFDAQAHK
ncbi:MAG: hypothetical protein V4639_03880 [Pseudomonadota bacterium]